MKGKGPKDGRVRPVYIIKDNKRRVVVSDGKGNCYECGNNCYANDIEFVKPEFLIDPNDYEFDHGLSGMDF